MNEYLKIQGVYKRDRKTGEFLEGQWSLPEFEYLKNNIWQCTEKIDGTNIRIIWENDNVTFKGRTDRAEIYLPLLKNLTATFTSEIMSKVFDTPVCLYGEGFGSKIQKGGGNYRADQGFILFDIKVGNWWLKRLDMEEIASQLNIPIVPIICHCTIEDAVLSVKKGILSTFGNFPAEGIVLKPLVELKMRNMGRVMTKIKHRDFTKFKHNMTKVVDPLPTKKSKN